MEEVAIQLAGRQSNRHVLSMETLPEHTLCALEGGAPGMCLDAMEGGRRFLGLSSTGGRQLALLCAFLLPSWEAAWELLLSWN